MSSLEMQKRLREYVEKLETTIRPGPDPIVELALLKALIENELISKSGLEALLDVSPRQSPAVIAQANSRHLERLGIKIVGEVHYRLVENLADPES